jgi:hypothetical protein
MAELDYAFIAEFAKVENGKLTAIGASYIDIRPPVLPIQHLLSIAGRARAPEDTEVIGFSININPPGNAMNFVLAGEMRPDAGDSVRYDGKVGVLFAFSIPITLTVEGLCEIFVKIDDAEPRRLAFRVVAPQ